MNKSKKKYHQPNVLLRILKCAKIQPRKKTFMILKSQNFPNFVEFK